MDIKKKRLKRLQDRLNQNMQKINQKMVGTIQRVLITGPSKSDQQEITGRTPNHRVVNIADSHDHIGKFVDVRITEAKRYTLKGEIII